MSPQTIRCENCGTTSGKMEDRHVWAGRPVCRACFDRLSVTHHLRHASFWMPLAIVVGVLAAALAVAFAITFGLLVEARQATASALGAAGVARPPNPPQAPSGNPGPAMPDQPWPDDAGTASPVDSTAPEAMTREQVIAALTADRTWFWHWERQNKDRPFKFALDDKGQLVNATNGKAANPPYVLQQRWVLLHEGHVLVPLSADRIRGFFAKTGRPAGAFPDKKLDATK